MPGISITYKNVPDPIALPAKHRHQSDVDFPVIAFDFNETLTPSLEYPIEFGPYPGVVDVLQDYAAKGCCLHLTTAGLYYGKQDLPVFLAKQKALQAWMDKYQIPMGFIGGKVPSDCYYDNDFIGFDPKNPDWNAVSKQIHNGLKGRFELKNGKYVPVGHETVGKPIPDDIPKDLQPMEPRGYSSVRLDVDFHRTLFSASSSSTYTPPKPNALEIVNQFYDDGVTIRLSCAGWSPLTHTAAESQERFNGLVWHCQKYGVRYDRIVTKDFHHVGVDDKGVRAKNWKADYPLIVAKLKQANRDMPNLSMPA